MDALAVELNEFMNSLMDRVDPVTAAILQRNQDRLRASGIVEKAIGVGDRAPDFSLTDQHGGRFHLHEALRRGPAVVIFVRGGWCPFCAITLRAFDAVRSALAREGASLVAISPSLPTLIQAASERDRLHYSVLADPSLQVAASYGLVWEPEPELRDVYARLGHDIPRITGTGDWRMPLPAGYVIAADPDHPGGIVRAARVGVSLVDRLSPTDAMEHVKALAKT